jgi:membrane fusion protein, multidrug efflux system
MKNQIIKSGTKAMKTNQFNVQKVIRTSQIVTLIMVAVFAFSCGGTTTNTTRLEQLKKEREVLDRQIRALEAEMTAAGESITTEKRIPTVLAQKVMAAPFNHTIELQGRVESDNNIFVPAQRPNVVTKIHVREGDLVKKGQLMAELDSESIRNSINEIKNGLQLATTIYNRQKNLYEKNIGTEVQYLQSKTSMEDLQLKLRNAETELERTKIYSPIDGMVDFVAIKEGEAAVPNMGAIRVTNLTSQKVVAKVAENFLGRIRPGDMAKIYFPVLNDYIEAPVSAVSKVIDPNNRTIDIEVKLPDDGRFNPNMLAVITIVDYSNPQAITLPVNAIQRDENRRFVYVAFGQENDWVAQLRTIETGLISRDVVEVTAGLKPGETVITFGFNMISAGDKVKLSFQETN